MSSESGPVSLDLGTCAEPLREKAKGIFLRAETTDRKDDIPLHLPLLRKPGNEASTAKGTVERN